MHVGASENAGLVGGSQERSQAHALRGKRRLDEQIVVVGFSCPASLYAIQVLCWHENQVTEWSACNYDLSGARLTLRFIHGYKRIRATRVNYFISCQPHEEEKKKKRAKQPQDCELFMVRIGPLVLSHSLIVVGQPASLTGIW